MENLRQGDNDTKCDQLSRGLDTLGHEQVQGAELVVGLVGAPGRHASGVLLDEGVEGWEGRALGGLVAPGGVVLRRGRREGWKGWEGLLGAVFEGDDAGVGLRIHCCWRVRMHVCIEM